MKITITRPPIPLLWLDTWCILELAAALDSKDTRRRENADIIVEKIISLTQKKKLICPEGDQDIEIGVSNNTKIVEKAREIQARMSLGISLNLYATVEHLQIQRMMKAVIEKQNVAEFPWKDIFVDDPIRTIDRKDKFIVSVHIPRTQQQINEQIRVHKSIAQDWESLRQDVRANKRNYDSTLALEFKGAAEAMVHVMANLAAKTIHKMPITDNEYMQSVDLIGKPLSWWEHYSGRKNVLAEVLSFYRSEEYTRIPFVSVGTRLLAELMSGNEVVSPSDVMDIHHMATIMPYASFMVIDKRIRNRIEGKTKLIKEYAGKILKWQDVLPLLVKLES